MSMDYISLGIGILGVVLAVFFYFKSRKIKRVSYSIRSFDLIQMVNPHL